MNRTVLVALLAVAVVSAGCGDGDDAETAPSPEPTAVTTAPATEAPEPTEAAESEGRTYRVRRGDTLSSIARQFDTTVRALARLNDIDNPNRIKAGRRLKIPPE